MPEIKLRTEIIHTFLYDGVTSLLYEYLVMVPICKEFDFSSLVFLPFLCSSFWGNIFAVLCWYLFVKHPLYEWSLYNVINLFKILQTLLLSSWKNLRHLKSWYYEYRLLGSVTRCHHWCSKNGRQHYRVKETGANTPELLRYAYISRAVWKDRRCRSNKIQGKLFPKTLQYVTRKCDVISLGTIYFLNKWTSKFMINIYNMTE